MAAAAAVVAQQLQAGLAVVTQETELVTELVVVAEVHALQHLELLAMVAQAHKDL
jgi:hypothetical protein